MTEFITGSPLSAGDNTQKTEGEEVVDLVKEQVQAIGYESEGMFSDIGYIDFMKGQLPPAQIRRPYVVFKVSASQPGVGRAIFKTKVREDLLDSATNEIYFLRDIAPILHSELPVHVRDRVRFPQVIDSRVSQRFPYILEEFISGESLGGVHSIDLRRTTPDDLGLLSELARGFRNLSIDRLPRISPGFDPYSSFHSDTYHKYLQLLSDREQWVRIALGEQEFAELGHLLDARKPLIDAGEKVFSAGDLNPSNMIKSSSDTRLSLIDWERTCVTNSPALDYAQIYALLYKEPGLQESFLQKVLSLNTDMPDFEKYFLLELVYFRGKDEVGILQEIVHKTHDEEQRATIERDLSRNIALVREAIGKLQ